MYYYFEIDIGYLLTTTVCSTGPQALTAAETVTDPIG